MTKKSICRLCGSTIWLRQNAELDREAWVTNKVHKGGKAFYCSTKRYTSPRIAGVFHESE